MSTIVAPAHLTDAERVRFSAIVAADPKRFSPNHADAIAEYCQVCTDVAKFRDAFRAEDELVIHASNKTTQINPLANTLKDWIKLKRELAAELGLSPLSETRAKLEPAPAPPDGDKKKQDIKEKMAAKRGS